MTHLEETITQSFTLSHAIRTLSMLCEGIEEAIKFNKLNTVEVVKANRIKQELRVHIIQLKTINLVLQS